jgi:D-3-phosphoglycerate dehydrogenase
MAKVLINDGIHPTGLKKLQDAGFEVSTDKIEQADLMAELPNYDAICVRSATKVRQELIDNCPNLKVVGRGGVGLDNIDVDYARSKNIHVVNTPAASSRSVAELVFAHLFSVSRSLYQANRQMPEDGDNNFKGLKKAYSKGFELEGKTLGVIGFGRIGQQTGKLALGVGMDVVASDPYVETATIDMGRFGEVKIQTSSIDQLLAESDVITLHIPFTGAPVLGKEEFAKMKDGVVLINAARGGTVDEDALLEALDSGKVAAAGLDVFINEPNPRQDLLQHPRVSLSPHIGASTNEAQEKIGIELADQLIDLLK